MDTSQRLRKAVTVVLPVQKAELASVSYHRPWADKTQLPAPTLPVIQTLLCALSGEGSQGERKKGRDHVRTPCPTYPSTYYLPECKSETKQQQQTHLLWPRSAITVWIITWAGQSAH